MENKPMTTPDMIDLSDKIRELNEELTGISRSVFLFRLSLDGESVIPSPDTLDNVFYSIESHIDRITKDLNGLIEH